MKIFFSLALLEFILIFSPCHAIFGRTGKYNFSVTPDTTQSDQLLYNGRIWRDLYTSVHEDQFLFSFEFLPGEVTINGKTYNGLKIRYDIFNDEITTITDHGLILQLNKEMVSGFTMIYNSRLYRFIKIPDNATGNLSGYVNVRYSGKSALYIKQKKEISKVAAGKNYENFVQYDRTYVIGGGDTYRIKNRKDFKNFFGEKRNVVKDYMKAGGIKVSVKSPDSFVPVLQFYDSLQQ